VVKLEKNWRQTQGPDPDQESLVLACRGDACGGHDRTLEIERTGPWRNSIPGFDLRYVARQLE
jgi:hypothetical protein